MILNMKTPQAYLKISVSAGSSYVIPISFYFVTKNIVFLADGEYDNINSPQSSNITELNFGSLVITLKLINQPFGSGGSLDTIIYNPNIFKIAFWPELEGDVSFTVSYL